MTSINKLTAAVAMIILLLSLSVYAQTPGPELNRFSTRGISFNYPGGYTVADESTPEVQKFVITRKGSSIQLTIVATRRMIPPNEYPAALESFKEPIIKNIETTLGLTNTSEATAITSELGSIPAEGVRLQSLGARKRTGEVIWLRSNDARLLALSFVRTDSDEADGMHLLETVRSSLRVTPLVPRITIVGPPTDGMPSTEARPSIRGPISGGVLNGKALELPKPVYPSIARAAQASGTVVVQVLIDEEGYVISAEAVSGHPLLQATSVAAAREAQFAPTRLAGQPVKVTGVIQYNFVAQ